MQFFKKIKIIYSVWLTTSLCCNAAEQIKIVDKLKDYKQQVKEDSLQKMVELKKNSPNIVYDLRYATTNNFTHEKLYKSRKIAFIRIMISVKAEPDDMMSIFDD